MLGAFLAGNICDKTAFYGFGTVKRMPKYYNYFTDIPSSEVYFPTGTRHDRLYELIFLKHMTEEEPEKYHWDDIPVSAEKSECKSNAERQEGADSYPTSFSPGCQSCDHCHSTTLIPGLTESMTSGGPGVRQPLQSHTLLRWTHTAFFISLLISMLSSTGTNCTTCG